MPLGCPGRLGFAKRTLSLRFVRRWPAPAARAQLALLAPSTSSECCVNHHLAHLGGVLLDRSRQQLGFPHGHWRHGGGGPPWLPRPAVPGSQQAAKRTGWLAAAAKAARVAWWDPRLRRCSPSVCAGSFSQALCCDAGGHATAGTLGRV